MAASVVSSGSVGSSVGGKAASVVRSALCIYSCSCSGWLPAHPQRSTAIAMATMIACFVLVRSFPGIRPAAIMLQKIGKGMEKLFLCDHFRQTPSIFLWCGPNRTICSAAGAPLPDNNCSILRNAEDNVVWCVPQTVSAAQEIQGPKTPILLSHFCKK